MGHENSINNHDNRVKTIITLKTRWVIVYVQKRGSNTITTLTIPSPAHFSLLCPLFTFSVSQVFSRSTDRLCFHWLLPPEVPETINGQSSQKAASI